MKAKILFARFFLMERRKGNLSQMYEAACVFSAELYYKWRGGAGKGVAEQAVVDHLGVVCWDFSLLMRL